MLNGGGGRPAGSTCGLGNGGGRPAGGTCGLLNGRGSGEASLRAERTAPADSLGPVHANCGRRGQEAEPDSKGP